MEEEEADGGVTEACSLYGRVWGIEVEGAEGGGEEGGDVGGGDVEEEEW